MLKLQRDKPTKLTGVSSLLDSKVSSLRAKRKGEKKGAKILHVNLIYADSGPEVQNQLLVKHSDVLKEFVN